MTGEEYLNKFTKEQLIQYIKTSNCCPFDFDIKTEYGANLDNCNRVYQGDCEKCWKSEVIEFRGSVL